MKQLHSGYQLRDHDLLLSEEPYVLRFRDLPIDEKPRELLQQFGPGSLSMAELIAIILSVGTRKEDVMVMSKRIVGQYGEKALLNETDPKHFAEALSIPIGKAQQIVAACELGRRIFATQDGKPVFIRTASQAFQHVAHIGVLQKEQLRGLYLNSRHELIHEEVISVGSLTANIVHPREVFQPALIRGAVAVIIAHNHPSGSTSPTEADRSVTAQLYAAGQLLGIELLDHLVVAGEHFESCLENNHAA
jgi:DNA repair protein RadC